MRTVAVMCVIVILTIGGMAQATLTEGFEGPDSDYSYYARWTGTTIGVSTEQVYSGDQSLKFHIPGNAPQGGWYDFARVQVPTNIKLADISMSWQTYVSSSSDRTDLTPYAIYFVDLNGDGVLSTGSGDALVIEFVSGVGSVTPDEWFSQDTTASTFHVVGTRTGLADGTFSASGTQGTLAELSAIQYDENKTWGQCNVLGARIAAGEWPNSGVYTAYVDDMTIVPEPATLVLLGLGGLLLRKRRVV